MSNKLKVKVAAGEHDRSKCPVNIDLPWCYDSGTAIGLLDAKTKKAIPCQSCPTPDGIRLTWLVNGLKAHKEQILVATQSKSAGKAKVGKAGNACNAKVCVCDDEKSGKVDVKVGGDLFTSYHYNRKWVRPFLYPVVGPLGAQVTRNWPMVKVKGEHCDHVHHKSIWVAYGECDDMDNWSEESGHGWQRHQGFDALESGAVYGRIVSRNDWCARDETKRFEEVRELRVYALPGGERLFDVDVTFKMTAGPVKFLDTKEGGLVSVRVASSMDVRNGGKIENGYGGVNEGETWGKKAPWCDYSGKVKGKHVGIAILDHIDNPRYPTEWHVRDYGLMTANCFAWNHYRPERGIRGDMAFEQGVLTTWRYRLHIHQGDAATGNVKARFMDYVAPPTVALG